MEYKIIENPFYTNTTKVGVWLNPDNEHLKFFLSGTPINQYPELLESAILSEGFGTEVSHFRPYAIMDWEDKANAGDIQENEIQIIHDVFGLINIDEKLFCLILYDYSEKLLEVYHDDQDIQKEYALWLQYKTAPDSYDREQYLIYPLNWVEAMSNGIKKLKEKLQTL